jgi:tRNA-splicing ligase RtcB
VSKLQMPDVHWGMGATVGSVIPTVGAIIPAAVGVDIGCGMMAVRDVADRVRPARQRSRALRAAIERAVPHGRTSTTVGRDKGAWHDPPEAGRAVEAGSRRASKRSSRSTRSSRSRTRGTLGTLGTGNHFIEICLDERDRACG